MFSRWFRSEKRPPKTLFSAGSSSDTMDVKDQAEEADRWREYAEKPVEERREHYRCGDSYVELSSIDTWEQYHNQNLYYFKSRIEKGKKLNLKSPVNDKFNNVVSLWSGDITTLEVDAIVNAVDGCIHRAAGNNLRKECAKLGGCKTGEAKITLGHKLPAKCKLYNKIVKLHPDVIHTVGPIGKNEDRLEDCYNNCLSFVKENNIKSIAFCCISTGMYGYPNIDAAHVALRTVRQWMETNDQSEIVDRIIFCTFLQKDQEIYEELLLRYFPCAEPQMTYHPDEKTSPAATTGSPSPVATTGSPSHAATTGSPSPAATTAAASKDEQEDAMATEVKEDEEEDITKDIPTPPQIDDFVPAETAPGEEGTGIDDIAPGEEGTGIDDIAPGEEGTEIDDIAPGEVGQE